MNRSSTTIILLAVLLIKFCYASQSVAQTCSFGQVDEMKYHEMHRSNDLCRQCWGSTEKCDEIRSKVVEYYSGLGRWQGVEEQERWAINLISKVPSCNFRSARNGTGLSIEDSEKQASQIGCNVGAAAGGLACKTGSLFLPVPFNFLALGGCFIAETAGVVECNL